MGIHSDVMTALRWLLVLPAALLGALIAQVVTMIVTAFMPSEVSHIVSSGAIPMGAIRLACRVAPAYRLHVAGLLVLALVLLYGVLLGVAAVKGGHEPVVLALFAPVGVAGSVTALYLVYRKERPSWPPADYSASLPEA